MYGRTRRRRPERLGRVTIYFHRDDLTEEDVRLTHEKITNLIRENQLEVSRSTSRLTVSNQ